MKNTIRELEFDNAVVERRVEAIEREITQHF